MAVNLHTTHYRFGIDELAESTHGWHANEDANPAQGVIAVDVPFLLRFQVQETGGTAAANTDNQFQCALNGGAFQNITTTSSIVKAVAAAAFANGANCTKRLTGTGTFETTGAGCTEDGLSGGTANDIAASGCSETECGLQIVSADVAHNDVITFRLTSPDFTITNDVVPTLTVSESQTIQEAAADTAGFTETFLKEIDKPLADAVALTEARVLEVWKTIGDTLGLAEGFSAVRSFFTSLGETVVLTEGFEAIKAVLRDVTDTVVLTETFLKRVDKGMAETVALTEGRLFSTEKRFEETADLAEAIALAHSKTLTETVGLTEQFSAQVEGGGSTTGRITMCTNCTSVTLCT